MKQISARQFRVSFGELTEPVTVLRRSSDGAIQEIGTWTPNPWPALEVDLAFRDGMARAAAERERGPFSRFGHSSPAPKPGAKK